MSPWWMIIMNKPQYVIVVVVIVELMVGLYITKYGPKSLKNCDLQGNR